MSAVFTKTAKESANGSFLGAAIVGLVGAMFLGILIFAEDLPTFVMVILGGVVALIFLWARSLVTEGTRYLKSGKDWRVEISSRHLSWQSPVQETMASFELPLSDIDTLRHIRTTRARKGGSGYWDEYKIELRNGESIKISDQISGIRPDIVFDALHEAGVPYEKEVIRTKEQFREKRELKRAKKREARAQRRLQAAPGN